MKTEEFETLQDFVQQGGSIRMLNDVDQKELDTLYQYAFQLFECKDISAARNIFYLLWRIDSWSYDYCYSLGLVCQKLNEHHEAIYLFGRAGMIQVDNPLPSYHAGLSFTALGNKEYARRSFRASLRWSDGRPEFQEVNENASKGLSAVTEEKNHVSS
ncbi:CesD/SycD/LcrH family type III secretion system chaperone [Parashewanella spongiae]|uniref:CesD/SycD/LcrH family type III secretion system chaperone n=1 Tax=Parashewanella spongiae TaxID=342950 RepID=A0A3A6TLY4_9GAMM|nr:SycD/LcrH family type III secretion system chaperone [Parashewanella spongiae]MCL1078521.1 SycD/LcrH family type III secretion system chaperone [Parashewanella spongiae]RJY13460.1 CesD/SycD/LcrH family type III secretion system chaperone [Parashewanella spongiae]